MFFPQLFGSFRPLHNPIGFGVSDFVLLALAILLSVCLLLHACVGRYVDRIARNTPLAMAGIAALAVGLRLALLPVSPIPTPSGADDLSYVLLADTLRHFRFANAPNPLHRFFEAVFVLQLPTYSSIYPLGQGLALALGRIFFGTFWAGVLLSMAAFCALCYWMLRGWLTPRWALTGGVLAILQFGPLNQWTNSYWGGDVSACAGCLVFGALPRLNQNASNRPAILLGVGLALQLITRPFEFLILAVSALAYFVFILPKDMRLRVTRKSAALIVLPLLAATALTLLQNKSVTRSWTTLPYQQSRYRYGVPTTFTFEPNPIPHSALTPEQDLDYRAQAAIHGPGTDSLGSYVDRLIFRLRYLRFFAFAPLYLALIFFLPSLREAKWIWAAGTLALFLAGTNFYPYFFPHYIAAVACLCLLIVLHGVEMLARFRPKAAVLLLSLCGAHFLFWYGIHLSGNDRLLAVVNYESWDYINFGDPEGRIAVNNVLARQGGQQLVFVQYGPQHRFAEWVANRADIDHEKVIWAHDLGSSENEKLMHQYPSRRCWLLKPDTRPPTLVSCAKQ